MSHANSLASLATAALALACAGCSSNDMVGGVFDTNGTATASASGGTAATDSTTATTAGTDSAGSGASGGSSGASGNTAGTTTDSSGGGSTGGIKFDTPGGGTATATGGDTGGDCGCGNTDWSYIWVANSGESTVSKINTRTLTEEGRYLTRADSAGNPSRTSVSVDGKAVVVANRHGGLTKIWARPEFCAGNNTSSGGGDVKPWGQDDCVAWHNEFSGASVQRPVAWTPGTLNPATCKYENQQVWTTTGSGGSPGQCSGGGIWVHLVNGETGDIDDEVHLANMSCTSLGPYGGAVDNDGDFWFHVWGNFQFVHVDRQTMQATTHSGFGYGITVDTEGRVWFSSQFSRFDPMTNMTQSANASTSGGIAQDLQGRMWGAGNNGLVWVDMETMAVGDSVALPGSGQVKGVSVDIDGYIWGIFQGDSRAFKVDPDTYDIQTFDGLNNPYTYSDMTGGQLTNVNCNPPEG